MPTFRSEKELLNYFKKMLETGVGLPKYLAEAKEMIENEAKLLQQCVQEQLDAYYNSYDPVMYQRKDLLRTGLRISPIDIRKKNDGHYELVVAVYFDPAHAWHPSLFGGEPGFVPNLINYGWRWKKRKGPYRLAYYEGFRFAEKGIQAYRSRSKNRLPVELIVVYKGQELHRYLFAN